MGDRSYLLIAMSFHDIAERIVEDVRIIHKSEKLSLWIQRHLKRDHAKRIAQYLTTDESRFFNALVVGVYGDDPLWSELTVTDPNEQLTEDEADRLTASVGIVSFSGKEKLFAIDGQHRVSGIKQAIAENSELSQEQVSVILVGHANNASGLERTRRLFVTLNQKARRVSEADIVALDEDNGFAAIARRIIDEGAVFPREELVALSSSAAIPRSNSKAVTSILGLYQILKDLYPKSKGCRPAYGSVMRTRPSKASLDDIYDRAVRFWRALVVTAPEYRKVVIGGSVDAITYRSPTRNHLLFRPVGQRAMARATECLTSRGVQIENAVEMLVKNTPMSLLDKQWSSILWNPSTKTMLKDVAAAETLLLRNADQNPRSKSAQERLDSVIRELDR